MGRGGEGLASTSGRACRASAPRARRGRRARAGTAASATSAAAGFGASLVAVDGDAGEGAARQAVREALRDVRDLAPPTAALLFAAGGADVRACASAAREVLPQGTRVIAAAATGALAGAEEAEGGRAVSVALLALPDEVEVTFFALDGQSDIPSPDDPPDAWADATRVERRNSDDDDDLAFVVLADPYLSSGIPSLIEGLDFAYPGSVVVGGLAAGGPLLLDDREVRSGAVGLALRGGGLEVESVVSQGCRPLSDRTYVVTKADQNVIAGMQTSDGRACNPIEVLQDELRGRGNDFNINSLMVGISGSELLAADDDDAAWLVRPMLGVDPNSGAVVIGDAVRNGQRVRWMVRDRESAEEDLRQQCSRVTRAQLTKGIEPGAGPAETFGALLFACNGRGQGLFREPNFESKFIGEYIPVPKAGFFANGEIGPVAGATHLHGFTSVLALLRMRPEGC